MLACQRDGRRRRQPDEAYSHFTSRVQQKIAVFEVAFQPPFWEDDTQKVLLGFILQADTRQV